MAEIARSSSTSTGSRSARSRSPVAKRANAASRATSSAGSASSHEARRGSRRRAGRAPARGGVAERGPGALLVAPARLGEQHQRIGPGAAERRRQRRVERRLVARVGQQREVRDPVADLLLRPVAAAADDVRRQALLLQRLLVEAQRARRPHEQDDVAQGPPRVVDLGAQPRGDGARLRPAPRLRREAGEPELGLALLPAGGLAGEQLDARLLGRVGREQAQLVRPAARHERREARSEQRREGGVDDVEDLRTRTEVDRQPAHAVAAQRGAARAEDADVGVPEAVDRLRLVADREQVPALQRLEHVELEPVGVLELVDHDQLEALRPARAQAVVAREQVAHAQLQVLEVDAGAGGLGRGVGAAEAGQQRVDQHERRSRVMVRAGGAVGLPGLAVGRAVVVLERLGAARQPRGVERAGQRRAGARGRAGQRRAGARGRARKPLARLQRLQRGRHARAVAGRRTQGGGGASGGLRERGRVGRRRLGRHEQPRTGRAAAAQRRVRARHHRLELAPVRGREVERGRAAIGDPGLQRRVERRRGEPPRRRLVEHAEARVQPRSERLAAQHARAEAVDRADPGGVDLARVLRLPELLEAPPDPLAQLGRGLVRERQRQDRADRDAVVADGLGEPLDHHGGLAGPGAGRQQRGAAAVGDRRALLPSRPARCRAAPRAPRSCRRLRDGLAGAADRRVAAAAVGAALGARLQPAAHGGRPPCAPRARARPRAPRRTRPGRRRRCGCSRPACRRGPGRGPRAGGPRAAGRAPRRARARAARGPRAGRARPGAAARRPTSRRRRRCGPCSRARSRSPPGPTSTRSTLPVTSPPSVPRSSGPSASSAPPNDHSSRAGS